MNVNVALGILQLVALTLPVIVILTELILSSTNYDTRDKLLISVFVGLSGLSLTIAAAFAVTYLYDLVEAPRIKSALMLTGWGLLGIIGLFWLFISFTKEEVEEVSAISTLEEKGNIFRDIELAMKEKDLDRLTELEIEGADLDEWPDLSSQEVEEIADDIDEALKLRQMSFFEGIHYKLSKAVSNPVKYAKENLPLALFLILGVVLGVLIANHPDFDWTPVNLIAYVIILYTLTILVNKIK